MKTMLKTNIHISFGAFWCIFLALSTDYDIAQLQISILASFTVKQVSSATSASRALSSFWICHLS